MSVIEILVFIYWSVFATAVYAIHLCDASSWSDDATNLTRGVLAGLLSISVVATTALVITWF